MNEVKPEEESLQPQLPPSESANTGRELAAFHQLPLMYNEDRVVFHPEPARSRRSREPVFLLKVGVTADDERLY